MDDRRIAIDPRWTLLQRTSLDELPQLVNVVSGRMSLVGPRPLLAEYLDKYSPHHARRHDVRPGITGLAQVSGRKSVAYSEKLDLDVRYIDEWSFRLDLRILFKTLIEPFRRPEDSGISRSSTTLDSLSGRRGWCRRPQSKSASPTRPVERWPGENRSYRTSRVAGRLLLRWCGRAADGRAGSSAAASRRRCPGRVPRPRGGRAPLGGPGAGGPDSRRRLPHAAPPARHRVAAAGPFRDQEFRPRRHPRPQQLHGGGMPRRDTRREGPHIRLLPLPRLRTPGREGGVPASAEVVRPAYAGLGFLRPRSRRVLVPSARRLPRASQRRQRRAVQPRRLATRGCSAAVRPE